MSRFLEEFERVATERHMTVYRVTEIYRGKQETKELIPSNPCQDSYSVAKAFVVTAIGFLYDEGKLKMEDKLTDFFVDALPTQMDARWRGVTLHDVLLHRIGLPHGFLDIDTTDAGVFGTDYLRYTLSYPLERDPGTESVYTDAAYYLLARVAERVSGKRLDLYLREKLWDVIGTREVAWSVCPQGHVMGATGLYVRSEDLARLGEIYLRRGMWGKTRILSEEWIRIVLENGYELRPLWGTQSYGKGGMRGQMLMVVPEQERVVAWHGYVIGSNECLVRFVSEYRN